MFLARSALIFASSDGPGSAFSPRRRKGWVGRARRPSLTRASPTHIVDGTYPRRARYSFPPRGVLAASSRTRSRRSFGVPPASARNAGRTPMERTMPPRRRPDARRDATTRSTTCGDDRGERRRRARAPDAPSRASTSPPARRVRPARRVSRSSPMRDRTLTVVAGTGPRVRADATRDAMRRGREDHRRARGGPLARPPRRRDPPSLASRPAPRLRRRLFPGA